MARIYSHMSRQQDALAVVGLALLAVILYALWGANILNTQKEATIQTPSSAVASL